MTFVTRWLNESFRSKLTNSAEVSGEVVLTTEYLNAGKNRLLAGVPHNVPRARPTAGELPAPPREPTPNKSLKWNK